jgi:hypothetical protein
VKRETEEDRGRRPANAALRPAPLLIARSAIADMLTIIKVSFGASALILLASCSYYQFGTGTSYQTPCLQGHICDCLQYTTVNRSWLLVRPH